MARRKAEIKKADDTGEIKPKRAPRKKKEAAATPVNDKPYKLVYFPEDRSTAVVATRVKEGVVIFFGTLDKCNEAQTRLCDYNKGLHFYYKSQTETERILKDLV